jgi:uncharacterized protein with von Willebrand factor type A (vWA) domain
MARDPFDATRIERRLTYLDALPDSLFGAVVTHSIGGLHLRTESVLRLRAALLEGRVPRDAELSWPEEERWRKELAELLGQLRIARFCRDNEALTDEVILSLLDALERHCRELPRRIEELFARLREEEERRQRQQRSVRDKGDPRRASTVPLTPNQLKLLRMKAAAMVEEEAKEALARSARGRWAPLVEQWERIAEVFDSLGILFGSGWDLTRGVLGHVGWQDAERLAGLVERIPKLRDLVAMLGRMQVGGEDAERFQREVIERLSRVELERKEVRTPLVPTETRGVTLSGDIHRMLPSESALLGNERYRLLWHARWLERRLASYRVEGVDVEWSEREVEREERTEETAERQPLRRGPILLCIDTSGSMVGVPETVAKAMALAVVRTALAENRSVHMLSFSGPEDLAETTLEPGIGMVRGLLDFLALSFDGGTDLAAPVQRLAELVEERRWENADALIVTDGAFQVAQETRQVLDKARDKKGLRVQGVLVGATDASSLQLLCDEVHQFTSWEGLG